MLDRRETASRAGSPSLWIIVGVLLAAVAVFGSARYARMPPAEATSVQVPERGPDNPQRQPSPQGPTGPTNTTTGGAPASSPQGETPAGMQAAPQGSSDNPR